MSDPKQPVFTRLRRSTVEALRIHLKARDPSAPLNEMIDAILRQWLGLPVDPIAKGGRFE